MNDVIPENLLVDAFVKTFKHYINSKKYICVTHIKNQYTDEWVRRKWASYKNSDELFIRQARILKLGNAILEFDQL